MTVAVPVAATLTLTEMAVELAEQACSDQPGEREITLLAVSVSNLRPQHALQLSLSGDDTQAARWGVDRSIDAIRDKFGRAAVGYAGVKLSDADRVPEEFRELAEH